MLRTILTLGSLVTLTAWAAGPQDSASGTAPAVEYLSALTAAEGEFPQANAWSRATPPVVWCGDPASTTAIEVHIVGRNDVVAVQVADETDLFTLYDDGSHGDVAAGDNVFTLAGIEPFCHAGNLRYGRSVGLWVGRLHVTLKDGSQLANNYGISIGLVAPQFKDMFQVEDFGGGLSATSYALFIEDRNHEVFDGYPVANVVCGKENFEAYRKLYSVLPDIYDFALVTPGEQIFRPDGFGENVPYMVQVSNPADHIGLPLSNNTVRFGSAGRLRSAIYESFGDIQIFDHEVAHTWGASIGASLGLIEEGGQGNYHWNALSDIGGQLGAYYFSSNGQVGHFAYNGNDTWRLTSNFENERYAPLELYIMGLISPAEVPPIHILTSPDLGDPNHITAASVRTVTIEDILQVEGGARVAEPQKAFRLAYIVTQDRPFTNAAYAYFSLLSYALMSREAPEAGDMYAPFYWATGGRATLVTIQGALTPPGAPATVSATAGDAQATVSFAAPMIDRGSSITGYTVTSSPGGITATGISSPIIVSGLANGTVYTFTVKATNGVGTGIVSVPSNSVTPTAPITVTADCVFSWAERTYPDWFAPAGTASQTLMPHYYRYYSQTIAYLAVTSGSLVYLGPLSDNKILNLGLATAWYATAGCN